MRFAKHSQREHGLATWTAYLGLVLYFLVIVGPLVWTVYSSFKHRLEFFTNPLGLPQSWQWINYVNAWEKTLVGRGFLNSLIVTFVSVPVTVMIAAMTAFALTRIPFRGRGSLLVLFISGMMLPQALVLVPLFILLQDMGLVNTLAGLILVYIAFGLPFTIFVQVPFFKSIPRELEEAALVDGGNLFHVFWRIALPLARNGLIIAAIFQFLQVWGEYVLAYTVIYSDDLVTLPLALSRMVMRQQYQADWGVLFAGFIITLVPVGLLYISFQRWITRGIMSGYKK